MRKFFHISIPFLCLTWACWTIGFCASAYAGNPQTPEEAQPKTPKKEFKAGDFIFDHIGDAHDWHIFTVGSKHVSVPLPIIVYSRTRGKLYAFMSSKFHHGYDSYRGFRLMKYGEYKGKIVEVDDKDVKLEGAPLPLDFSIKKNVAAIFFSVILMLALFIPIANKYKREGVVAPRGAQNLVETVILFVRDEIARPSIGEKHYARFMPFLLSLFFFIWINNLLGLIPIFPAGANVTGNIAVPMGLAIVTLLTIAVNGNSNYWKHIFNTPGVPIFLKLPIPIMPFVEVMGMFIKPFVLMVRLFANILAGHIIVMVLLSLIFIFGALNVYLGLGISPVSLLLSVFMKILELLVAAIQAFVFTMLSSLYLGMAVEEHH